MLLETNNLTKRYGTHFAVKDINIHLEKGQIYGLVGRNGAGKTTILKMLSGLSTPTSGYFEIFGKNGINNSLIRSRVGCLIESPGIYPNLTAYDNLMLKCKAIGITDTNTTTSLLNTVGLTEHANKKTKGFSLGMKQRLGIALALVGNPDIVILDEPINGLDPQGIVEVRETIEKLNKEQGITFIISSHLLEELSKIATKYGIIHNGELLEELTSKELFDHCTKRIELNVNNTQNATVVLDKMNLNDYVVIDNNHINLTSGFDNTHLIIKNLVMANIDVYQLTIKNETLEDYYIKLTGGTLNV